MSISVMLPPKLHFIPGQSQWLEVYFEEPLHHPLSIRVCTSCFSEEDLDVATEPAAITKVGTFMKIQRTTIRMEIETEGAMLKFLVDECKGKWSIYCYIYDSTHFNNLDTTGKWMWKCCLVEPNWSAEKFLAIKTMAFTFWMSWKFLHYHISWFFKFLCLWLTISSGLSMKLALSNSKSGVVTNNLNVNTLLKVPHEVHTVPRPLSARSHE